MMICCSKMSCSFPLPFYHLSFFPLRLTCSISFKQMGFLYMHFFLSHFLLMEITTVPLTLELMNCLNLVYFSDSLLMALMQILIFLKELLVFPKFWMVPVQVFIQQLVLQYLRLHNPFDVQFYWLLKQINLNVQLIINSMLQSGNKNMLNLQQTQMQKLRARSQNRLYDKDLLPSLKANSVSFMGKTIVPLSKFDLDSNVVLKQQRRLKLFSKFQNYQQTTKSKPKSKKNLIQSLFPLQSGYKLSTSDSKREISHDNFQDPIQKYQSKNLVTIDLSKTSSKSYGFMKGYAANSHPGLYNTTNQDRICIVTNLNKTNVKTKQVSFFSIYNGSNGLMKADYYRDNFHLILNSQQQLLSDPQKAIKNTIYKIQRGLTSHIMYTEDLSRVAYAILVSVGETGYIVICGNCRAAISKNFGQEIQKINSLNQQKNITKVDFAKKCFIKKDESINIFVKKVNLETDLDFILLGSEGLFENVGEDETCRKVWGQMIKSRHQNIHSCLGQATLNQLHNVFRLPSTKNASIIMLGFKNIQNCLKKVQKLELPYLEE